MARQTHVEYQGRKVSGQAMEFESVKETWDEYKLENGGVVRVRLVPGEIVITEEKNQLGKPLVIVESSILIQYREPDEQEQA